MTDRTDRARYDLDAIRTRAHDAGDILDRLYILLGWVRDLDLLDAPAGRRGPQTPPPTHPRPDDGIASRPPARGYVSAPDPRRGDPDIRGAWLRTETLVAQGHDRLAHTAPTTWAASSAVLDGHRPRHPLPGPLLAGAVSYLGRALLLVADAQGLRGVHVQRLHRACQQVERIPAAWSTRDGDLWHDPRGTVFAGHHVPEVDPRCTNEPCPHPRRPNGKGGYGAECRPCYDHRVKHNHPRPVARSA